MHVLTRLTILASPMLFLSPIPAQADIMGFGDFSGFRINRGDPQAEPLLSISPSEIHLTGLAGTERRSIFFKAPQATAHFTASFTYQAIGAADPNSGFAFVLQNSADTYNALGGFYSGLGYSGTTPSTAVEFPLGSPFFAGVFTNGTVGVGTDSLGPVNLLSGHPIDIVITYDGSFLTEHAKDTITNQSSATYLHLASLATSAYIGLTATTNNGTDQAFSNFQFTTVPEPATLALLAAGGAGLLIYMRKRRSV